MIHKEKYKEISSVLNENIKYPILNKIAKQDKGFQSNIYEIEIHNNKINIALGKINCKYQKNNINYIFVYVVSPYITSDEDKDRSDTSNYKNQTEKKDPLELPPKPIGLFEYLSDQHIYIMNRPELHTNDYNCYKSDINENDDIDISLLDDDHLLLYDIPLKQYYKIKQDDDIDGTGTDDADVDVDVADTDDAGDGANNAGDGANNTEDDANNTEDGENNAGDGENNAGDGANNAGDDANNTGDDADSKVQKKVQQKNKNSISLVKWVGIPDENIGDTNSDSKSDSKSNSKSDSKSDNTFTKKITIEEEENNIIKIKNVNEDDRYYTYYEEKKVPEDGNCLYNSILSATKDQNMNPGELDAFKSNNMNDNINNFRKELVKIIKQVRDKKNNDIQKKCKLWFTMFNDDDTINTLIKRIESGILKPNQKNAPNASWGGNEEVSLIECVYGIKIKIISKEDSNIQYHNESTTEEKNMITLFYVNGNHYNWLKMFAKNSN